MYPTLSKKQFVYSLLLAILIQIVSITKATAQAGATTPFKTTWKVAGGNIIIPTLSTSGPYNYTVNYRKKGTTAYTTLSNQTGNCTISPLTNGDEIEVEITGTFPHFYMNYNNSQSTKLLSIDAWGNQVWKSMQYSFAACYNLVYNATDNPDLSVVTDMSGMFTICPKFNGNIGGWNTSNVTNMSGMFTSASNFNQNIGSWNTSKVTFMTFMFENATAFNQDLSGLEINAVNGMNSMLNNSGLSTPNYDATLTGWLSQNKTGLNLGAAGLKYCAAEAARTTLTKSGANGGKGWTISGDALLCPPSITTTGTLTAFSACVGTVSAEQSFSVSGTGLSGNITITAPTGFQISNTSGGGFGSMVGLVQNGGSVANTTIYVRIEATATGTPSGNITCTSTGATTRNIAVSGTVNALPTITLGSVSNITTTATTFSLPYTATAGSPNQYSVTAGTPNAMSGFSAVSNASLTGSPLGVTVPASAANTYNFVATVSNSTTGCVSANNNFTVTVEVPTTPFITRWDLSKTGSGPNQISFGVATSGTVSYTWQQVGGSGLSGSGTFTGTTATITGLPTAGVIDLSIIPTNFQRININNGTDKNRLTQLKQWGTAAWTSMQDAFAGCSNMNLTATDTPNTAAVTNMSFMFSGCSIYNQALPANFNTTAVTNMSGMFTACDAYNQVLPANFNTAAVTDMSFMFRGCRAYNQALPASFNTTAVRNMRSMFDGCTNYNQALPANFNTTAVTVMSQMFSGCKAYNQVLPANFNTAAVTDMGYMFASCMAYNQALPASFNTAAVTNMKGMFSECSVYNKALPESFNTATVTDMSQMFRFCKAYNQALPASFNTAKVTNMSFMFDGCNVYNQALPTNFNTAKVTDMSAMFNNCSAYNQALPANFNTVAVTNMSDMFRGCSFYNQPLPSSFNTSAVTDMRNMFSFSAFNQNVGNFNIGAVTSMTDIFKNSGISVANYDAILTAWNTAGYTNKNLGDTSPLQYCAAAADRANLVKSIANGGKGWTITGDKTCTTTTLVSSQNPSSSGSSVTFTVTVSPSTATGTVTFKDGTTTLGTGTLSAGQATFATTTLPAGTRSITAVYNGDASNATNTSAVLSQVVLNCALTTSPGNVDITWTGFQNKDWNNACNWSPTWVPDITNAKAIIPGSQEDQPIISGTIPDVNSIEVSGGAVLTVNSGATLNIRENGGVNKGIWIASGTLINNGTINIESVTNTAIDAYIYLATNDGGTPSSIFTNNGTVKINSTDEAIGVGYSKNSIINNNANGIINVVNGIGIEVALPTDVMTFVNAGIINYNGSVLALSLQGNTSFTNSGTININSGTGISQTSSVSLTNNGCGKILMATGTYVNGGGTTLNRGLIQMPTAYNYTNTGTFTNNGIVKANTVSGITNNNVIISNTCPIFTVGGSTNYTINGIFTNAAATTSAGTYTSVGNLFVADNTLPNGSQTLYAKLSGGDCDDIVIVPFNFDNVKPTAVSVSSTTICEGLSVNLLATCASGTPTWYGTGTGGITLGTGISFSYSPPVVGENQIFYAACETTNCKSGRVSTSNTVTVNPNPTALASSNSPVCEGNTINLFSGNEEKIAIISGAEPPQTYAWTGVNSFTSNLQNPSIPSATVSAGGTYKVTVSSFEGCTATATTLVMVKPSPVLNPSSNSPVCSGQTLFLYANGENSSGQPSNDTYTWTGVNNFTANTKNPVISNVSMTANGVYTVSAVNSSNCSATATVMVTVKETPTLVVSNFTNPTPENNPDGTISFTTNLPNSSFSLSYGSTGSPKNVTVSNGAFTLSGLVSGVYGNFAVTNDGCTGRNNTEVTLLSTPFTLVKSITTGNWESSTTWNIGRAPKAGDVVIIDASHAVTINSNCTIKDIEVRGQLIYGVVGIIINLGL